MNSTKMIVVGGGFWGSEIARRGEGLLIDDGRPMAGSRAAAGFSNQAWFGADTTLGRLRPAWMTDLDVKGAFNWLEDQGAQQTGEWFSSVANPTARHRDGLWSVKPTNLLEPERLTARVDLLERKPGGWRLRLEGGDSIVTEQVVIAAGVWTDELLSKSKLPTVGVGSLKGQALILKPSEPCEQLPRSWMVRPYKTYTARAWEGGLIRFGDTVEKPGNDGKALADLRKAAKLLLPDAEEVGVMGGFRPVCDRFVVEKVAPGLVVATGGHRVGLAVAPIAASRTLKLLKED